MNLVEFAEKISPIPLTDWQKKFLEMYEQAQKENKQLILIPAMRSGKRMTYQIIDEWNNREELKEHRCSCGRLLGRFNGQAEVKCPKCGKMNVIGIENKIDSYGKDEAIHFLEVEIIQSKDRKNKGPFFDGVDVGIAKANQLFDRHIRFCKQIIDILKK